VISVDGYLSIEQLLIKWKLINFGKKQDKKTICNTGSEVFTLITFVCFDMLKVIFHILPKRRFIKLENP
jgi:hypothetical protein